MQTDRMNQAEIGARTEYSPHVGPEQGSEPVSRIPKASYKPPYKDKGSSRTWGHTKDDEASLKGKVKEKEIERRRARSLHLKRVQADVFIPSIVSVENLARLLNVRLGQYIYEKGTYSIPDYYDFFLVLFPARLQRTMRNVGMEDQSSYDHSMSCLLSVRLC